LAPQVDADEVCSARREARATRPAMSDRGIVPAERIERAILVLRGHKVMLDADLAALYGVETKVLSQAVRRNQARFPADFMFQLTAEEYEILRSQSVTSSSWGGRRYLPCAFTEQGVAMLSSVLRSPRAVEVNVEIMRAFVRLRHSDLPTLLASPDRLSLGSQRGAGGGRRVLGRVRRRRHLGDARPSAGKVRQASCSAQPPPEVAGCEAWQAGRQGQR
jgi:hypothetical protein